MNLLTRGLVLTVALTGCVGVEDDDITIDETGTADPSGDPDGSEAGAQNRELAQALCDSNAAAASRAYGVGSSSTLLPVLNISPVPDTQSGDTSLQVVKLGQVVDGVFLVAADRELTVNEARASASAQANDLLVTLPGLTVSAGTLRARVSVTATAGKSTPSSAGSYIQNLIINGTKYGDIYQGRTIPVAGVGTVSVLAIHPTPNGRYGVTGLNVSLVDNPVTPVKETTDINVVHAEAKAYIPDCGPS